MYPKQITRRIFDGAVNGDSDSWHTGAGRIGILFLFLASALPACGGKNKQATDADSHVEANSPPQDADALTAPGDAPNLTGCTQYFDGCNTCAVEDGRITMCTEMFCDETDKTKAACISREPFTK